MATHTMTKDRSTTWTVTGNSGTWTTKKGADIFTLEANGIFEAAGRHDNKIFVNGNIDSYGETATAIFTLGTNTDITIAKGVAINASYGIMAIQLGGVLMATGLDIVNHGNITASYYGIFAGKDADIINDGRVTGLIGVYGAGSTFTLTNAVGGYINSAQYTFVSEATVSSKLVNHGLLSGAGAAVYDGSAKISLVNDGTIVGMVSLGGGNDTLDTRGGIIKGDIYGGDGDDIFYIDRASFHIIELSGMVAGIDTVKSTVDFALGDNIEKLYLLGTGHTDGEGNSLENMLVGNSGNNNLYGYGGEDILKGGKGNDRLIGGLGNDTFVFYKGYKQDTIVDFENSADKIQLHGFAGITDFATLSPKISQSGDDARIEFGAGDVLILKGTLKTDLDLTDFLFV